MPSCSETLAFPLLFNSSYCTNFYKANKYVTYSELHSFRNKTVFNSIPSDPLDLMNSYRRGDKYTKGNSSDDFILNNLSTLILPS